MVRPRVLICPLRVRSPMWCSRSPALWPASWRLPWLIDCEMPVSWFCRSVAAWGWIAPLFSALRIARWTGPPRVFRTAKLSLFHAASCRFRYSSRASCGVRYPSPE